MTQKPRLGRGLEALLGGEGEEGATAAAGLVVPTTSIQLNPYQPRKHFDEDELNSLAESIKVHGILQPLVVRPIAEGYQLVAGERRLRAAQRAGLVEVPVHVVQLDDQQLIEAALVENIHRTDLNPIEKAQGFADYLQRFGLSDQELAARLGLGRSTISNLVGLLTLPPEVQEQVRSGQLSVGHAKVIKGMGGDSERQVALAREVMLRQLSVRELEEYVKEIKANPPAGAATAADTPTDQERTETKVVYEKTSHVLAIEKELQQRLLVRGVTIKLKGKDKGQIVLTFDSNDDFERLVEVLRR
jgi:ParB family chromosome partitioning protein